LLFKKIYSSGFSKTFLAKMKLLALFYFLINLHFVLLVSTEDEPMQTSDNGIKYSFLYINHNNILFGCTVIYLA